MRLTITDQLSAAQAAQKQIIEHKCTKILLSAAQAAQKNYPVARRQTPLLSAAQAAQKVGQMHE